ncbi:NucA/NucB deoxyribonuclease domain-containing protein [Actinosynnema sp. CS-041913]|uniref:NucA/NucB deoxyribonuclease domain-containing protein n=1 Tax=Actinosynnema sp. CS-041913 TaxID=3239917 RepID=UPI003D93B275
MATKSTTGLLLPLVLVAAGVIFWPQIQDNVGELLDGVTGGMEILGEGETRFMVSASAAGQVKKCTPQQSLTEQACDDLKFVIFDAARMPFITQNISEAWREGKPGVLTKDSAAEPENRKHVCLKTFPRAHGGQCDEYPFASTREGGRGAREMEVPPRENACQGGTLRAQYGTRAIKDGDTYLVVIIHPDQIAQGPYQGTDIAKEPTC